MDIFKANRIGIELLDKHGLLDLGWHFKMDNAKRRFGVCRYRTKVISISLPLTTLNSEEQVTDTILHEIAHALVGPRNGHGQIWKAKAIEVGCKPERCYNNEVKQPKGNYEADCPSCGHTHTRTKKPRQGKRHSCGVCQKGFNHNKILVWKPTK